MKQRNYISLSAILILIYVLFRVANLYPRWENHGPEATLSWDVFGYYLYLPAYFIYDDLGQLGFIEDVFSTYQPAGDFHHAVAQPDGRYVMKYPIGMALLYLPFFFLGHVWAWAGGFPMDGFSEPYQFAISMGGIVYAAIGLFILRRVLLRYFSDMVSAIVLGVIVLATNYLNYVSFDGAMPHNVLFTLYALILWLTIRWHEKQDWRLAAGIGLAIGLATIVRPTELMSVLIPLLWGIQHRSSLIGKFQLLWEKKLDVLVLGVGIAAMGVIQLIYWKAYSRQFLYYSYGEYTFDWLRPHIWNGWFSFRKGWLIYTPVMVLALLGFIPLFKQHRDKFLSVTAYFAITTYVVFAWQVWWYGGSFGARPLVQAYAILALPLAACIAYILKRRILAIVASIFMLICADLNLMMTWQAHNNDGIWEAEYMTKAYYWKIFGSANPPKSDKIFLDVRHELKNTEGMNIRSLYENSYNEDTVAFVTSRHTTEGNKLLVLDGQHQYSPSFQIGLSELSLKKKSWIRVQAKVFFTQMQWDRWQQAQLVTQFIRDGKPYKATAARIQRTTDPWVWHDFVYEMKVPKEYQDSDELKVYFWNAGSQTEVFVDYLKVELIEPKE